MLGRGERPAGLLDVRIGAADAHLLGGAAALGPVAPDGRLVVVDDAACLVDHHDWYVRLAAEVPAVVCVAVGPICAPDGFELRQSTAVGPPWVTLWVGDVDGVRWAGGSDPGADHDPDDPAPYGPADDDQLGWLLTVLRAATVFDAVLREVGGVRYQVVSPALAAAMPSVGAAELRSAQVRALRELTAAAGTGANTGEPPPGFAVGAGAQSATTAVVPGGPLGTARAGAQRRIDEAGRMVAALHGPAGLVLGGGVAWQAVNAAGAAVAEHQQQVDLALDGMQRRIDEGAPEPVTDRMGLADPDPCDDEALAAELRATIEQAIAAGGALPDVVVALRANSRLNATPATAAARHELDRLGSENAVGSLLTAPVAEVPAAVVAAFAVGAAVSAAVVGHASRWGIPGAVGLVLLWVLALVVPVARRPAGPGAAGAALRPAVAIAAAGGVGLLLPLFWPVGVLTAVPAAVGIGVAVVLAVACLMAAVWGWQRIVAGWTARLRLREARATDQRIAAIFDTAVAGPYRQARTRRRRQEAADLLSVGLSDVVESYRGWLAARTADGDGDPRATPGGQVTTVVRADLGSLAVQAVHSYLDDIAAGVPLLVSETAVAEAAAGLTDRYQHYLDAGALTGRPPVPSDPAVRAQLAESLWRRDRGVRTLLTGTSRETMTQLCRRTDLRALDSDWSRIRTVRFAPGSAQSVLLGEVSDEVLDVDVEAAGALRLVPMRGGVVRRIPPATERVEQPPGGSR